MPTLISNFDTAEDFLNRYNHIQLASEIKSGNDCSRKTLVDTTAPHAKIDTKKILVCMLYAGDDSCIGICSMVND